MKLQRKRPYAYRGKRRITWWKALAALVLAGILVFAGLFGAVMYGSYDHIRDDPQVMVILGCRVMPEGHPSILLQDRLDKALDYLEEHPDVQVVVSGGQGPGETMTEGEAMSVWLEAKGIDPSRIIVEDKATSTMENLQFSFELIRAAGGEPDGNCAIVTSEYHLCRAKMMAADLGVEAWGVAGHTTWPTLMLNYFIREAFAVTYYRIFGA